jgi:hypothetical protein
MPTLPDRSIVRKLTTILEMAGFVGGGTTRDLANRISAERRIEFSFFRPAGDRKHRLGYSTAASIASKVRFAVAQRYSMRTVRQLSRKRSFLQIKKPRCFSPSVQRSC